jgi:hypothetical protein
MKHDYDKFVEQQGEEQGILARAQSISKCAGGLLYVADTLRAVNMDRLAAQIEGIYTTITDLADPIPGLVIGELNQNIAHGQHMVGGLLQVALKMADLETKAAVPITDLISKG